MDTAFYGHSATYSFEARAEIAAELGYSYTYLTLWSDAAWNDVARVASSSLPVRAVWVEVDISLGREHPLRRRVSRLLAELEGCSRVEVALVDRAGSSAGDPFDRMLETTEWLVEQASHTDLQVLLYPHVGFPLHDHATAIRLCREFAAPGRLGTTLSLIHWFVAGETNPDILFAGSEAYLGNVNVCGLDNLTAAPPQIPRIRPVGMGEFDEFAFLASVATTGYTSAIGVQGYAVGGDPYIQLGRSRDALKSIDTRLASHPHWGRLENRTR
ncbi:sugar phosphate isomerase/epimerase family protein [Microbacterium sp. HJ5]